MHTLSKLIAATVFSFNVNTGLFGIDLPDENGSGFILDLSNDEDLAEFDNLCDLFIGNKVKSTYLESVDSTLFFNVNIANAIVVTHITSNDKAKEVCIITGLDLINACEILDKISRIM